jgi:cyclomaltodextrinase
MQTLVDKIKPNDIWQHYKGKQYRILAVSCHSEDLTLYVVYETLYDNPVSKIWHRPLEMFLGTLEIDGAIVPRFMRVGDQSHSVRPDPSIHP